MIDLRAVEDSGTCRPISEVPFPAPFASGVEYAAPARGPWNIVHVGMLIPESHQIFVCAQGCLRGVVLTAAEMGAGDRFSTITVRENNVLDGDMERLIIDGTTDILEKLGRHPRALLIYTSCIHHFIGCDLEYVYKKLRERFPDIDFTDCYMNPIMRKSKMSPDAKMRQQLYSLLKPREKDGKSVNIIGNIAEIHPESELLSMLRAGGFRVRDICWCRTYDEYQEMAESAANISWNPAAVPAGETLAERLGQEHFYLPLSYDFGEITANLQRLSDALGLPMADVGALKKKAELSLERAAEAVKGMPVLIDYTATPRPLGLAKLLLEHGFQVESVYADSFTAEDKPDYDWLREHCGNLEIHPTIHPKMGLLAAGRTPCKNVLAIGQKAAYFNGTNHFVNLLEGGGLYGFEGICALCDLIEEAAREEKDTRSIIQVKGWGCCG